VPGLQTAQLQHDEEQEEDDRAAGIQQVLPFLPEAHGAQGNEMSPEIEDGRSKIEDCITSSI